MEDNLGFRVGFGVESGVQGLRFEGLHPHHIGVFRICRVADFGFAMRKQVLVVVQDLRISS